MRGYLERMRAAPYAAAPPAQEPPLLLAALGPRMLALAAELADGAHPYNTTPEHTARARQILGPRPWLCVEQKLLLETQPSRARERARAVLAPYLALPNYRKNLQRLGFGEADLDGAGSDRLVDALVAWGDEKALTRRVQEHLDAGATHVCVQPLDAQGGAGPDERVLRALAPRP
jgi:probable F420-dependent oxidoreductase